MYCLFVLIEFFLLGVTAEALHRMNILLEIGILRRWVSFGQIFTFGTKNGNVSFLSPLWGL